MKRTKKKPSDPVPKEGKEKSFPGYPLYAPAQDEMVRADRVDADLDDPSSPAADIRTTKDHINPVSPENENLVSLADQIVPADDYAVTREDLAALGSDDLNGDGGDDDQLRDRTTPVDFTAEDLDIPGSELDDAEEDVGSEDEENNSYSLGGDDHNDLEEDKS
jgi:hypothetical protein